MTEIELEEFQKLLEKMDNIISMLKIIQFFQPKFDKY
jgi:hypothetical protein